MLTGKDIHQIQNAVQKVVDPLKKDMQSIKTDIRKLRKDQKISIRLFDHLINYHHRRLDKVEKVNNITPPPYLEPRSLN